MDSPCPQRGAVMGAVMGLWDQLKAPAAILIIKERLRGRGTSVSISLTAGRTLVYKISIKKEIKLLPTANAVES